MLRIPAIAHLQPLGEARHHAREILRATLQKVAGDDTNRPVTIRADARSTHQSVVTAMDVAARLGFTQVNIATISQQAEE